MGAERVASEAVVVELKGKLTDAGTSLPHKYRVLFSLRNIKGEAAREALAAGACLAEPAHVGKKHIHVTKGV